MNLVGSLGFHSTCHTAPFVLSFLIVFAPWQPHGLAVAFVAVIGTVNAGTRLNCSLSYAANPTMQDTPPCEQPDVPPWPSGFVSVDSPALCFAVLEKTPNSFANQRTNAAH